MRGRLPDPARQSLASNARLLSGQTIEGKKGPAHVRGRRGVLAFRDQAFWDQAFWDQAFRDQAFRDQAFRDQVLG